MARRQAGDARRRDLFLRCVQEIQPAARRLLSPRGQGRENRRSRDHLHVRRARQSRTAADRRPASRSCRKHWWEGTDKNGNKRDIGATTLEPPLGSGAYRIKEFSPGRNIVYERVKDYWGADAQRQCRPRQFRRAALRIFPRHDGRARGVQGRHGRLAHREQRQELGDRLRLSRGQRQARHPRRISDQQRRRDAGVRLQHPPRQVSGSAGAARFQLRVRFRGDEQADFLRPVQAHRQLFRGHRAGVERPAQPAANWRSWKRCATKSPPRFSPTAYSNPVGGNPQAVRGNLREAVRLFKEAGYEVRNEKLVNGKTGEPLCRRIPRRRSELRALRSCSTSPRSIGSASTVTVRTVDDAQYENRLRAWDFDIVTSVLGRIAVAGQ